MTTSTRWLALLAGTLLVACSGGKDGEEEHEFRPTLQFLAPSAGEAVPAGELQVSIVVEDFELSAPEQASSSPALPAFPALWLLEAPALAHNEEGAPRGYCELSLDGAVVGTMDSTQLTLTVEAGDHELQGRLLYADGDELEEPVSATVSFRAE